MNEQNELVIGIVEFLPSLDMKLSKEAKGDVNYLCRFLIRLLAFIYEGFHLGQDHNVQWS